MGTGKIYETTHTHTKESMPFFVAFNFVKSSGVDGGGTEKMPNS